MNDNISAIEFNRRLAAVDQALNTAPQPLTQIERLEERRNVLMNSFGQGGWADGKLRKAIEEIDAQLIELRTRTPGDTIDILCREIDALADEFAYTIETHIYDGNEPKNAPERKIVTHAETLTKFVRRRWRDHIANDLRSLVVISTAHVPRGLLTAWQRFGPKAFPVRTFRSGDGWMFEVSDDIGDWSAATMMPAILDYARDLGVHYVMLDASGQKVAGLPVFEQE